MTARGGSKGTFSEPLFIRATRGELVARRQAAGRCVRRACFQPAETNGGLCVKCESKRRRASGLPNTAATVNQ